MFGRRRSSRAQVHGPAGSKLLHVSESVRGNNVCVCMCVCMYVDASMSSSRSRSTSFADHRCQKFSQNIGVKSFRRQ